MPDDDDTADPSDTLLSIYVEMKELHLLIQSLERRLHALMAQAWDAAWLANAPPSSETD